MVIGQARRLLRGVGMGGPASPFIWALCYDPIIWLVSRVARCRSPTYVDDLAANICGPRQALAAQLVLLSASRLASLTILTHNCSYARAPTFLGKGRN